LNSPTDNKYKPGTLVFVCFLIAISLWLILNIGNETKVYEEVKFLAQPRFWPEMCLIGMATFSIVLGYQLYQPGKPGDNHNKVWAEILVWIRPVEYMIYFMIYVFAVGKIGYLFSTLLFCPALAWRCGYRDRKTALKAMAFGFIVVLFFKTFLQIKIPGGQIYEWFPNAIRNFMIINF
jgi:hypothetical protein